MFAVIGKQFRFAERLALEFQYLDFNPQVYGAFRAGILEYDLEYSFVGTHSNRHTDEENHWYYYLSRTL
jgi:hypothetical protein